MARSLSRMLIAACTLFLMLPANAVRQPVIKNGKYHYSQEDTHKHIDLWKSLTILGSQFLSPQAWAKKIASLFYGTPKPSIQLPKLMPQPTQTVPAAESITPVITWVGHATFLIQVNGFNILTDPIFGDIKILSDPGNLVGPFTLSKRTMKPGIKLKDLPRIDAIVISHNHSDHTDTATLQALQKKYNPMILVPAGDGVLFKSMGFTCVKENNWGDATIITKNNKTVRLTFLPAYHWSIRFSLSSYRASLWGSWMINAAGSTIYFAGDTAYGPHFKEIAQEYPSIDIALMPIGPTKCDYVNTHDNPHKLYHVDAKEAVDAFMDLNARCFIPMHYATFFDETHVNLPLQVLTNSWEKQNAVTTGKQLLVAQCGRAYQLTENKVNPV
jgi:L-ascorbate metabolism protein UlaG (beta-lactamase superfamily)